MAGIYSQNWRTQPIPVTGVCNANFELATPEDNHALLTVVPDIEGGFWTYVKAGAAITAGGTVAIGSDGVTTSGSTHTAAVDFNADDYGWVKAA